MWLIVLLLSIVVLWLYFKFFKIPKIKNIVFIDGSLGTGKSYYSVALAIRLYKKMVRQWRFKKVLFKVFKPLMDKLGKSTYLEEPMLYSNIPLRRVKHVPLTLDILLRKKRMNYKSVVLIDEISMVADQFDYKDRFISDSLRVFFKLFRHETRGGFVIINSQSTSDLHYSIKSVLSDYFYIHHKVKAPFFSILKVQEMAYTSDKDGGQVVNAHTDDIETNLKMVFVLNKYYKCYDTYCYSILTDALPVFDDWYIIDKRESAKTKKVLTFKEGMYKVVTNEEEKDDE